MADDAPGWSTLLGLGLTCGLSIGVGALLGWLVDRALGSSPLFIVIGLAVGIVCAASYTVVQFRKYLKQSNT